MKVTNLLVGVFLALVLIPVEVFSAEPDEKLHKQCLYPTVIIKKNKRQTGGSGFIVRSEKDGEGYNNVAVTCAHVFEDLNDYLVGVAQYEDWSTMKGYSWHPCRVYAMRNEYDLAVITFKTKEKMPLAELGFDEKMYIGTDVFHIGCGCLDEPRLDCGKVSSVKIDRGERTGLIRTTAFTVHGDSGGPLFCNYRVVGIIEMIRVARSGYLFEMSYSIPVGRLKTWSEERNNHLDFVYKEKQLPALPYLQLRLESEQAAAAAEEAAKKNKGEK